MDEDAAVKRRHARAAFPAPAARSVCVGSWRWHSSVLGQLRSLHLLTCRGGAVHSASPLPPAAATYSEFLWLTGDLTPARSQPRTPN